MSRRSLYLAAYDVRKPSRLRAALKRIREHATGGQKSVHEVHLTPAEHRELLHDMSLLLEEDEDRFLPLRLDPRQEPLVYGKAVMPQDPTFFYGG